jgi:large subunit ribosomal protein L25
MAHEIPKVTVEPRERLGSRYAARLRKSGRLPAVIYGHQKDPVHVAIDTKQLTTLVFDNAHLLEVKLADAAEPCLIKDVQWDYLGKEIIHVDLTRVDLSETVEVEVGVELIGEAVGLKEEGAFLDHQVSSLTIECRADSIPELIEVDVSELGVDQAITVADLKLPEGVKCTMDEDTIIAQVTIAEEETEPTEAGAESAEPEVIGKKPEEGEGEAEEK